MPMGIESLRTGNVRQLTDIRAGSPGRIAEAALGRARRPLRTASGKLMLVAADHPARGVLGVRDREMAMASRTDLLERLTIALARPGVDGVLGTADILEDLLLLGALDNKLAIGSMNRGGIRGAVFELDDRFTAFDVATIAAMRWDGGKMLVRIDPADPATVATMEAAGRAVTELAAHRLMAMVEPSWSHRVDGRLRDDLSADAMIHAIAVASGLGATSAYTWLKVPVVDDLDAMARVMDASTLPALLLGGDPQEHPGETFSRWRKALRLPTVRGLIVGRALLYPPDDDVAAAVDTAVSLL
jgi:DhnA family fructose-bisphosphate aldolase class Ia